MNDDVVHIQTDQTSETLAKKAELYCSLAGIFSHTDEASSFISPFKNWTRAAV